MKKSIIIFFAIMLMAASLAGCGRGNQSLSAEQQAYFNRVLTDQQLASLKDADLDTLRASISTIGDAVAYLDQFTPQTYSGFADEIRLDVDFVFNLHTSPEATTPQTYTAFAAWCITDDFDGIQYVISAGMNSGVLRILPLLALPVEGGFWVYSPYRTSLLMKSEGDLFVDIQVDALENLEEKIALPWSTPNHLQIFVADANQRMLTFRVDEDAAWAELNQGEAEMVFALNGDDKAAAEEQRKEQRIEMNWDNLLRNWNQFGFPDSFAPTLQRADVEALIGKDIDTVSAALKTVGDVMYYFALSGYEIVGGDMNVWEGDYAWSFNRDPDTVFSTGWGNCGGTSGIFSYFLQGDYDGVGILTMTCSVELGGGHVINYVQADGMYYVFDPQAMCLLEFTELGAPLCVGDTVISAGRQWQARTNNDYRLIFAYPSSDGDMPHMGTGKIAYLPEQYRNRITIVYEDVAEGYRYEWKTISDEVLEQINGIRNPMTDLPGKDVTSDTTGSYMTRVLTDEQLAALKYADADTLQAWISTVADAVAYLDQFACPMFDGLGSNFELDIDVMLGLHRQEATAPEVYTAIAGWCLADDYEDVKYLVASGQEQGMAKIYHSLLLPGDKGYHIINPAQHSVRQNGIYGLEERCVDDLNGIAVQGSLVHNWMADDDRLLMYHLFLADAGNKVLSFTLTDKFLTAHNDAKELYRISEAAMEEIKAKEKAEWDAYAKNLKVSEYGVPGAIGKTTLSYQAAYDLVGKDPEVIRASVKTVGDVLQYMIAARFGHDAPSAYTPWYGSWGFDAPGDVQLEQNYGCCCGGFANTVSYLLKGDYEKVGTLRWVGGGNHTISWVYTGGKYYVFDFTQYCSGGRFDNYNCPVMVLDRLEDFYDQMPDTYSYYPKSEVVIMVAFEAGDAMYPSNWSDPPNFTGLTFPKEAEGKITVIYQKDPQYGVEFKGFTATIPGWNDR